MSLEQAIIIKNEFTNNAYSQPGKGSRGASPGQYVMRYMAREDATEVLAPVKLGGSYDSAAFTRYMARNDATEQLKAKNDTALNDPDAYGSPLVLKYRFKKIDKQSGRAFGSSGLSLSHDELLASSHAIQQAFDDGHSVQKIILSFTEEYLRETGVLDPSFVHKGRGSYKGHIDQLKLRQAITNGVNHLTKAGKYVDPVWVGTIQLDTSHVHAHIALVDKEFSPNRVAVDGADRGKINAREKKMFRKGIHYALEDMRDLKSFHRQTSLERQNVVSYVKDYAYDTLRENTQVQLLIASLPKQRQHWRYGTNRKSMERPNEIARDIVEYVFATDPENSGYLQAMRAIYRYANESEQRNRLRPDEKQNIIDVGRERLIERSVNGLYQTLKSFSDDELKTRTTMIDIQSSSEDALIQAMQANADKDGFDPAAFALRVRGYNKRQQSHQKDTRTFYDLSVGFDDAKEEGLVDDTAHVMRLFYEEELRYHMGLTDKYRTFLSFHHDRDVKMAKRLKPKYDVLFERYHQIVQQETTIGHELTDLRQTYKRDLTDYTMSCFEAGVASLKEWDSVVHYDRDSGTVDTRFVLPIAPKPRAENLTEDHFKTVKALDVHHLGLDYYNRPDARIDAINAAAFADAYESRRQRAEQARLYVASTGQQLDVLDRARADIADMESVVRKALDEGLIQTITLDDLSEEDERQLYTIAVDQSIDSSAHIRQVIEDVVMDESTLFDGFD